MILPDAPGKITTKEKGNAVYVNYEVGREYYPMYAFGHPLFTKEMRIYSDSKVSEFLCGMTLTRKQKNV